MNRNTNESVEIYKNFLNRLKKLTQYSKSISVDELIKLSSEISNCIHESPHMDFDVKKEMRNLSKLINETVAEQLDKQGLDSSNIRNAEKADAEYFNTFRNEYISSIVDKNNLKNSGEIWKESHDPTNYQLISRALKGSKEGKAVLYQLVKSRINNFFKKLIG